jgi:hypothetical protein
VIFPLSWSGHVTVVGAGGLAPNITAAAGAIESALVAQRPKSISRIGADLRFEAGVFRLVSSNNVLVPITKGQVSVQAASPGLRISYTIYFTEVLVFSAVVSALFAIPMNASPGDASILFRVAASCLPLIWLFGGNVAITMFRFPRLLRRAVRGVNAV